MSASTWRGRKLEGRQLWGERGGIRLRTSGAEPAEAAPAAEASQQRGGSQMVNVTERAKERLKELVTTKSDDLSVGLRLERAPSGAFGIFPDRERPDDQIVEHQGAVVLLLGQEIAQSIADTTIDCDESGPNPRLVIRRG